MFRTMLTNFAKRWSKWFTENASEAFKVENELITFNTLNKLTKW